MIAPRRQDNVDLGPLLHSVELVGPTHESTPIATTNDKMVEKWPLHSLQPHPKQRELFHDLDQAALTGLAEWMRKEGLLLPVEILPDGIIISGHQRVRAAHLLGWAEIDVVVRHELAGRPDAAVQRLIDANRHRRQLTMLDQVRIEVQLLKLDQPHLPRWKVVDHLHAKFSKDAAPHSASATSKKHLGRLYDISQATVELQAAVEHGRISIVNAVKLAKHSKNSQLVTLEQASAGKNLSQLIRNLEQKDDARSSSLIKDALARLAWRLQERLDPQSRGKSARPLTFADALEFLSDLIPMEREKLQHRSTAQEYIAELVDRARKC
jgi:ParB-like chromosome segregation protein Spo0J